MESPERPPDVTAQIPETLYARPWRKGGDRARDSEGGAVAIASRAVEAATANGTLQRIQVAVRPFTTFSGVDRFRHALDTVPDITEVRTKSFQSGVLHLELACKARENIQSVFNRVPGFRCEVVDCRRDQLEVEVEEAA
jgi:hypothetical protein